MSEQKTSRCVYVNVIFAKSLITAYLLCAPEMRQNNLFALNFDACLIVSTYLILLAKVNM